jgi:peptidoglycan DL-endopeptidase CwlO
MKSTKGSVRVFSRLRETKRETKGVVRAATLGLTSLALGTAVLAGPATTASADPAVTIPEAKAQIEQLQVDAEALNQDYLAVQQQVDDSKAEIAQKQQDAQLQAEKVAALRKQVGQAALAQFQDRNVDTAAQLFLNSDTEGFLSQVSTIEKVGANQNTVLQDYQQQSASLVDLQKARQTDLAALEKKEADLASLKARSDQKLTDAKAVLDKLTEQQRKLIEQQEKAQAEAAARTAADGGAGKTPDTSAGDPGSESGSSKGQAAVAFAKRQLGKPYVFGAAGPNAYDCSGLTLSAWRAAGVSLSRTSQSQYRDGRSVAKSDLQPGDLVFYYSGISHVALYVGGGQIIHAPNSRSSVKYAPLDSMPYMGARRPA